MIRLIYVSQARRELTEKHLQDILATSRRVNTKLGITGILTYHPHGFMQCLEGEREAVEKVYAGILCDSRHSEVKTLAYDTIEKRLFPLWTMAYVGLDEATSHEILRKHRLSDTAVPHYVSAEEVLELVQEYSEGLTRFAQSGS
jgi:hypothetical protein